MPSQLYPASREYTRAPEWYPTPLYQRINGDVDAFPPFVRDALIDELQNRCHGFEGGEFEAGTAWYDARVRSLKSTRIYQGFDVDEIATRAEKFADLSVRLGSKALIEQMAFRFDLDLPKGNRNSTDESIARRCYESKAWRRSMHRNWTRIAENELRAIGFIERGGMLYCSDLAVQWYKGKMRAQELYLRNRIVDDGAGTQLNLWDVAQKSLSNKSNRRTELMTRMRGFEDYAKEAGHVATFATLTCPSAFHARSRDRIAGYRSAYNKSFKGYSVRQGQAWLGKMWARTRSRLHKLGVPIYGFRVAEPHHDGTPHWHMVLFTQAHHRGLLRAVLSTKWLSEYSDEPGARLHRTEFKCIEDAKGSATGYISKYIAKNIDGHEVGEDFEQPGTEAASSAIRVTAWASMHGIRQFQQIGGPPIGPWREFRRVRDVTALRTLEPARQAADDHQFARYITFYGGVSIGRAGNFRMCRVPTDAKNAYGEQREPITVGVESATELLETRWKKWTVTLKIQSSSSEYASSPSQPMSPSMLAFGGGIDSEATWNREWYTQTLDFHRSYLFSALGPVSITVPAGPGLSEPRGWTNPNETSTYGPR